MATQESSLLLIHTASIPLSHPLLTFEQHPLNGVWHEIRLEVFFNESTSQGPLSVPFGSLWIFTKIRGKSHNFVLFTGANDTVAINYCWCPWHRWLSFFQDSMTPAIIYHYYECKQQPHSISTKIRINFLSQRFFPFIAGVVDTGDQPLLSNIFLKTLNGPNGILRGPGETYSWKSLKSKISSDSL